MNVQINAKTRFQSDPDRLKWWRELVVSEDFTSAIEATLVHLQMRLPGDPASCAHQGAIMQGARRFVETLLTLGEQDTHQQSVTMTPLNPV